MSQGASSVVKGIVASGMTGHHLLHGRAIDTLLCPFTPTCQLVTLLCHGAAFVRHRRQAGASGPAKHHHKTAKPPTWTGTMR